MVGSETAVSLSDKFFEQTSVMVQKPLDPFFPVPTRLVVHPKSGPFLFHADDERERIVGPFSPLNVHDRNGNSSLGVGTLHWKVLECKDRLEKPPFSSSHRPPLNVGQRTVLELPNLG
ncbi:MAG: hypothetical protein ABEN55_06320, partial [Bradymonadaceae bacterium]